MHRTWLPLLLLALWLPASDARAWDFYAPEQRSTSHTAYSLAPQQWELNVGVLGTGDAEIFGELGLGYGFGAGLDLQVNFLHMGVGLINFDLNWNFLDTKYVGLGVSAGFTWGHGDWMWILPEDQKRLAQGLDIYIIPIRVNSSFPVLDWLQLDLAVGYTHVEAVGQLSTGGLFYDGTYGAREVVIEPAIRFNIPGNTMVTIRGRLPVWAAAPSNLEAAVELDTGIYAGLRTADYKKQDPMNLAALHVSVTSELAHLLYLDFTVHYTERAKKIYGSSVGPSLRLTKRF